MKQQKSWNEWLIELNKFIICFKSNETLDKDWLTDFYEKCLYSNNKDIDNQIKSYLG